MKRRVHWSRPWALAVLSAATRRGIAPLPPCETGPRQILFLLPQVYGGKGGILEYNQQLIRAAADAFPLARLTVVSANDVAQPLDADTRGRIQFDGAGPRSKALHKVRLIARALRHAVSERPDLIVCGHVNLSPLAMAIQLVSGSAAVLIAHGIEAWHPRRVHRWTSRRFTRVFPVSRFTAEQMRSWGIAATALRIVPNTIDGDVFRLLRRERSSPLTLLTVARLDRSEQYKGVDKVLGVLPEVLGKYPEVVYKVAGDGTDLPRLRDLVARLGLERHVSFLGRVADADLPALYAESSAFVMPSVKEGFGIVFLESLACGTPVVAGNRDGSVDAVLDGELGELVDPDDAGALRSAIERVLANGPGDSQARRDRVLTAYGLPQFRAKLATELRAAYLMA